jgi:hypothetical protein
MERRVVFDDHRVPPISLEEIESEADRCRSYFQLDSSGRIDVYELLKALKITLIVKSDAGMGDDEACSKADEREISCRRSVSRGLRFGDPHARYVIGHELGHMFLHRGSAPKARKIGGNRQLAFISEDESSERQAWKFARALFVTRLDLTSGEGDEDVAIRVGIPPGAVSLRREEVQKAMQARQPKTVQPSGYLKKAGPASTQTSDPTQAAWDRAGKIPGEDPAKVRSARGFRVEWSDHERLRSQVGWTVVEGEVRSFMDLATR